MTIKPLTLLAIMCAIGLTTSAGTAQTMRKAMTLEGLLQIRRVTDPRVSPNGKNVAFTIGDVNFDDNRVINQIYVVSMAGGEPKQLTTGSRSASSPRWSPDGKRIAFVTGGQIWTMNPESGDDREQVTRISTGASGPVWSTDGGAIAFVSDVYPECADDDCNRQRDERDDASKVKAHVTDRLLFRHWDEWRDLKRTHVFVVPSEGGDARDLTPGDFDSPPFAAASGVDYAFSPDGKEIAFLRNPDNVEAVSTNSDIYVVSLNGGAAKNITIRNKGYDAGPVYTRDGKSILYLSQATEGFEADRWRLMSYNRAAGTSTEITQGFDLQVDEVAPSADGNSVYFTAIERGLHTIYKVSLHGGQPQKVIDNVYAGSLQVALDDTLVFASSSLASPPEIYRSDSTGRVITALTNTNKDLMAGFGLRKAEETEWTGAGGRKVHGFIVKPANFDGSKKYPLLVLIHGGPQSAWTNSWSYRWNPQIFAAADYVVFLPNFRGSVGYGQQFVNEVSGDWGGKAHTDIMNGVAFVLNQGLADRQNVGAAGASYGGYMVNWIEGHNNDRRFRFKALVAHASMFNLTSLYGATDELWFPGWEFRGTPWAKPGMYARWSPKMFVKNFKTPLLVTHGELDYRSPIDQALQLFTALQRMGVESKLLVFPDEGHWILKPQNSALWYTTVIDWFDRHLKSKK